MMHDKFTEFHFVQSTGREGERQAYRTVVPGLVARVSGTDGAFPVDNVSAGGIAMLAPGNDFAAGESLTLDLLLLGTPYIIALPARVVRLGVDGLVGCAFSPLDLRQEARLDKLILEVQKRLIAWRKAESEKRDAQAVEPPGDSGPPADVSADADKRARFTVNSAAGTELDV